MKAVSGGMLDVFGNFTNGAGGKIQAIGEHSKVEFSSADYSDDSPTLIENAGKIVAKDHGHISFDDVGIENDDIIKTASDGRITFDHTVVDNTLDAKIAAIGCGSTILFSDGTELFNQGIALAKDGGQIDFWHATVDNETGGEIEAGRFGTLSFVKTSIDNETDATIGAVGHGAQIIIRDSGVTNTGILLAADCGSVCSSSEGSQSIRRRNRREGRRHHHVRFGASYKFTGFSSERR